MTPIKTNHEISDTRLFFIKVKLAGVKVEIEFRNIDDFLCCRNYLSDFLKPDFVVNASREEIKHYNDFLQVKNPGKKIEEIRGVEFQIVFKKIAERLIDYDIFLMHGVVIETDGNGYMFTAPSGTGKTTRAKLWLEEYPDSIIVNGDKPLIKIIGENVIAYGTPWCGKEGDNNNTMVPLRAVFLLERANENTIKEISLLEAFPTLLQQINCPSYAEGARKAFQFLKSFDGKVKIFKLSCMPTREAIRLAYTAACPK